MAALYVIPAHDGVPRFSRDRQGTLLVADCQRISEKLLVDPAAVWEMHGEPVVLECLALTDPGKLATIVAEKMSS